MKKICQHTYIFRKEISSAYKRGKSFLIKFSLFLPLFFHAGCEDPNEIGLVLLPENDQIITKFSDSSTVVAITVKEDSLYSDELSIQQLGKYNDPIFGLSTASVYMQVNLQGTPAFGISAKTDSFVLSLDYAGYYGDTAHTQILNVYRMTQDMYIDSNYYSFATFSTEPSPIGTRWFAPTPHTIIVVDSDSANASAHLRIALDTMLGNQILGLNGSEFSSNANWLAYFKGLYLDMSSTPPGPGAISYFSVFGENSKLTLYFHNNADTVAKKYEFSLVGARLNHFDHDYTGTPVEQQLISPQPGDTISYAQSMTGLKSKITFPYLKHFLDSGSIVINRAELSITADPGTSTYYLPERMLLVTENASGQTIFPIDYYESSGYYGGFLNVSTNQYVFNIARHLQRYLDGVEYTADFHLIISASGVIANRAVVKSGAASPSTKMKLSIFYTKIN